LETAWSRSRRKAQLFAEINDLTGVMIGVRRTAQKHGKAVVEVFGADADEWRFPIAIPLCCQRGQDHVERAIEVGHDVGLWSM
jgi:hypothetical protein